MPSDPKVSFSIVDKILSVIPGSFINNSRIKSFDREVQLKCRLNGFGLLFINVKNYLALWITVY
jgi:hypothetical protein